MGPKNLIIIFNPAYVRELFQRRRAKYSGRPYSAVPLEHVINPGDQHVVFLPNDAFLKRWRTAARHILSPEGVSKMAPLQDAMAHILAYKLLKKPDAVREHIHEWSLETPLLAIAGQRVEDYGPGL